MVELALAAGAAALATHLRARSREQAALGAHPPIGQMIEVPGGRIHAVQMGAGPDLLLIHGASGNLNDFTMGFAQRLARRYRVTALDRPGLGHSTGGPGLEDPAAQARRLAAAAAALGVTRPIVLGHSYGGAVALAWALAGGPVAPGALVLASGAAMPWPGGLGPLYPATASRLGRALLVPLITAFAPPGQITSALRSVFAPQPVPPGYGAHLGVGLILRRDTYHLNARQVNGLKPYLRVMARHYPGLGLPVELIHGQADRIVPAHIHAEAAARLLPRAHLTLLPGIGHMPHHVAPDAVIAAIDRAALAMAPG